jgi:hypothetical protein
MLISQLLLTVLPAGMLGSGIFVSLFGMGYFWDVHLLSYYLLVSVSSAVPADIGTQLMLLSHSW